MLQNTAALIHNDTSDLTFCIVEGFAHQQRNGTANSEPCHLSHEDSLLTVGAE